MPASPTPNFVARQTVWALEQDLPLQFLPQANAHLRKVIGLDFSPASIERMQQWMAKQRSLRAAAGRALYDHERDGQTLMMLSYYVAEWVGRTLRTPPHWALLEDVWVLNFPGDAHASYGMVKLPGLLGSAWSEENVSLPDLLSHLINMKVWERPADVLPALPAQSDVTYLERYDALPEADRALVWSAMPPGLDEADALAGYFVAQRALWHRGQCVRADIVQAHPNLYQPAFVGMRVAEVVFDPQNLLGYDDLAFVAQALQVLSSNQDVADWNPEAAAVQRYLDAGTERWLSRPLPVPMFGYPLVMCSIWVDQNQLPDGMLSYQGLPLVIAPGVSTHAKLLPMQVWSEAFRERWLAAGEARLGRRYALADLKAQAGQGAEKAQAIALQATTAPPAERMQAVALLLAAASEPIAPIDPSARIAPIAPAAPAVNSVRAVSASVGAAPQRRVAEDAQEAPRSGGGGGGLSWRFVVGGMVIMGIGMYLLTRLSAG